MVCCFFVFVRGQSANFTRIPLSVNRISEFSLAHPVPAAFFAQIPTKLQNDFALRTQMRENFTQCA
jgi:hypothetical protein